MAAAKLGGLAVPMRYRFDLESSDELIRDETGVEAVDLDHASMQALAAVEEMRDSGELAGVSGLWELVIRDEDDVVLKRIPV
ncbi:DUF6894 family protein [Methylobacterium brachythecii]|uniref:DUF6894 domain-containing protein n=2 Tax=Methylobacterium brachythecii TaxID=1176177 RepID=A0ABQ6D823_9HYPH|nr:hypothetical protein GCM10007884_37710 [Methylobacterium brachythecii]